MGKILTSVACNLDVDILSACFPLFQESRIEAIEWSYDALFNQKQIPEWFLALLKNYSENGRLIGHGIFFSLFRGKFSEEQKNWLKDLGAISKEYNFDHITEHFGFFSGSDFHNGAPLSVPYTATTLAIGQDRLKRIQQACNCPVGLENLAFAYDLEQVKEHGEFLEKLITPVNGFIILDLHNIYCQLENFNIEFQELLKLYPLERVREIHISGGSWETSLIDKARRIRRDTHDDHVPEEVFALLEITIDKCPNLKYVVLEQLGIGLKTEMNRKQFYKDFLKMEEIVKHKNMQRDIHFSNDFRSSEITIANNAPEDELLFEQQCELSNILERNDDIIKAMNALKKSSLADSYWNVESWNNYMIETAISIVRKWNR
jgi:uncharacterized protein